MWQQSIFCCSIKKGNPTFKYLQQIVYFCCFRKCFISISDNQRLKPVSIGQCSVLLRKSIKYSVQIGKIQQKWIGVTLKKYYFHPWLYYRVQNERCNDMIVIFVLNILRIFRIYHVFFKMIPEQFNHENNLSWPDILLFFFRIVISTL